MKICINGEIVEVLPGDIDAIEESVDIPLAEPTVEERIAALEEMNEMLLECLLEMSEEVYA